MASAERGVPEGAGFITSSGELEVLDVECVSKRPTYLNNVSSLPLSILRD